MSKYNRGYHRRTILGGLGLGAAAFPLWRNLPSAEAASVPSRLLVFFTPNEPIRPNYWQPTVSGESLVSLPAPLASLEPHKGKLLMIGNMKIETSRSRASGKGNDAGHNLVGAMLTGQPNIWTSADDFWGGGVSVDQFIAEQLKVKVMGLSPGLRTVKHGHERISYTKPGVPFDPEPNPRSAFDKWLAGANIPPDQRAAIVAQKRSVLDAAKGELMALQTQSARLSTADRTKLQSHADALVSLDSDLNAFLNSPTCQSNPKAPTVGATSDSVLKAHIDVAVQVLACNGTRVGFIQVGGTGQQTGNAPPGYQNEHALAHDANKALEKSVLSAADRTIVDLRVALEKKYYDHFAYLLSSLDAIREGNGTLLDNTLVLWTKSLAHGHHAAPRGNANLGMFFMVAGGKNLGIRGGRYMKFGNPRPHNDLLAAICNTMLGPGKLPGNKFGDPAIATGAISLV